MLLRPGRHLNLVLLLFVVPSTKASITRISDNVGLIKGNLANNARSDDRRPTLSGTLNRNLASREKLRIYSGSTFLGNAVVRGRTWSYTHRSNLATNRTHSL